MLDFADLTDLLNRILLNCYLLSNHYNNLSTFFILKSKKDKIFKKNSNVANVGKYTSEQKYKLYVENIKKYVACYGEFI